MSQNKLAEDAVGMMERAEAAKAALSTQEIVLDGSNKVNFPGFPYKFEALGKKIIVSIDVFKSGYECKTCAGKGKISIKCVCESTDRPGKKYSTSDLMAFGSTVSIHAKEMMKCSQCDGNYEAARKNVDCPACQGRGASIILPEVSKNLPTTGVVVSIGNKVNLERLNYKIGDRIIFGPYAGNMLPTKVGLMFKILDATQAWAKIEGGENLAAFDFVISGETSA